MKKLVLAEKPSVAREIARVLKCTSKGKGYFEGPQYVITWALGHLVTLAEPEDYDSKYKTWNINDLPMIPEESKFKVIRQTSQQFQAVKGLFKRSDLGELIIATDAGREGELVARLIMIKAGWKKPFKRLWISSQTDEAIREGFAKLKPGYEYNNLYAAALSRAEADWLIGLNITRALSCKFNAQLTAGRVQTPTLAMIVNRETEIKNFVPTDYWTLRADFDDYFGDWRAGNGNGRITDQRLAEAILEKVKGKIGRVESVKTEAKSEPPPLAYDLTELQRDSNRRYGLSAQQTLSALQNLYEQHKLVTYPRTDSRYISTDIVPTLPDRLKSIAVGPYEPLAKPLLGKAIRSTKRFVDDSKVSDHHAIIPTGAPVQLAQLKGSERNVYDLVVRRFLAVLYPSYTYDQTTITTVVEGERFISKGKVVKDIGWRLVASGAPLTAAEDSDKLPEQVLKQVRKGEEKQVKNVKITKSKTKPPARYTEATLLTAMESPGRFVEDEELRDVFKSSGLGTPATRAEIIEKLINSFYIERQGKELVPTSKGIQLIDLVDPALKTPELTAQWEQKLTDIAKGRGSRPEFMAAIKDSTRELIARTVADTAVYKADNITKTKCPSCGKPMLAVKGKRGKMLVCQDRTCGYRQSERENNTLFGSSKRASRENQKLLSRYNDNSPVGQNLGELFKDLGIKTK